MITITMPRSRSIESIRRRVTSTDALSVSGVMTISQLDLASRNHGSKAANVGNRFTIQRRINFDHGHRFPAPLSAAQVKLADIDSAFAQNSTHPANDSGHIAIMHDQHVAARDGFNPKAVDLSDAALAATGNSEDSSRSSMLP